ncbi:protein kinase domain-containing protein [Subtercola boreus]|uniref:protein kinase domain-containing protein n=1 Tax=Subtercola boreus TaxID=120213 RepID=UPI001559F738|nr:hypothetical protein [Subtercola boreus]
MSIAYSSLQLARRLGEGGEGVVHEVAGLPVRHDPRRMAFKEPKKILEARAQEKVLTGMRDSVAFRESLSASDRAELDALAVWPVAMVVDAGKEIGCLMPLIPSPFLETIVDSAGAPIAETRGLGALSRDEETRRALKIDTDDDLVFRMQVMANLARAIEFLHHRGIVYGDINPRNAVYDLGSGAVLLLDCDATASISDSTRATRQGHFPFWEPPEYAGLSAARLQGFASDCYKLGLALLRFLDPGPGSTQRKALTAALEARITPEFSAVIARAVDQDPHQRPSAAELSESLRQVISWAVAPPSVNFVSVSRSAVVRGQDVRVEWSISSRSTYTVAIQDPQGTWHEADAESGAASIRIASSGVVSIRARSSYSEVAVEVGQVECYELPKFSVRMGRLPRLALPGFAFPQLPPATLAALSVPSPALVGAGPSLTDEIAGLSELMRGIFDDVASVLPPEMPTADRSGSGLAGSISESMAELRSIARLMASTRPRRD